MAHKRSPLRTNFRIPKNWDNNKCIFVPIPKTGTTSIAKFISKPGPNCHPDILEIKQLMSEEKFDSYFKFAFVRNPWDRAVSIFLNRHPSTGKGPWCHKHRKFSDFVKAYKNASDYCKWPSAKKNQLDWLTDENGNMLVDFIGKFENLRGDFAVIIEKLGFGTELKLPHLKRRKTERKHYTEYYDDETRKIIAKTFAKDIEYFGYKFGE